MHVEHLPFQKIDIPSDLLVVLELRNNGSLYQKDAINLSYQIMYLYTLAFLLLISGLFSHGSGEVSAIHLCYYRAERENARPTMRTSISVQPRIDVGYFSFVRRAVLLVLSSVARSRSLTTENSLTPRKWSLNGASYPDLLSIVNISCARDGPLESRPSVAGAKIKKVVLVVSRQSRFHGEKESRRSTVP